MPTRDNYQVGGSTLEEFRRNLNFLMQRFADRMDKIEGIRGTASISSDLDMNSNKVVDLAEASDPADALRLDQFELTGTVQVFESVAITQDLQVSGDAEFEGESTFEAASFGGDVAFAGYVYVYDSNGLLIHSME